MNKLSIPKGTRDYNPEAMARRTYIFDTIESVFRLFGYHQIQTPSMENLETLLGKYGEEGDKLLFRILNSGNFLSGVDPAVLRHEKTGELAGQIADKGLRYDLTVPFARYVVQHRNEIHFPFKRYQIQPVWRADRPQKGRYREFFQCDADIIGSRSMLNELELIEIIERVFNRLAIPITIKLNHRKILAGLADMIGAPERILDLTTVLDKLDKIGKEGVILELKKRGFPSDSIDRLDPVFAVKGSMEDKLAVLGHMLPDSESGTEGLQAMKSLADLLKKIKMKAGIELDLMLARGLNYYTGVIIEVLARDVQIGSLCGGGRYDDLTGIFGLPDVSGVGISFGADRIYDVLDQMETFPDEVSAGTKLLFINFGEKEASCVLEMLPRFRDAGIPAELYPDPVKLKKQMSYAHQRRVAYVAMVGENEMKSGNITLKDMASGEQYELSLRETIAKIT